MVDITDSDDILRALGFPEQVIEAKLPEIKKTVSMSNPDGRKVTITMWEDDTVTVVSSGENGEPQLSTADSPEQFYVAQKFYSEQGLREE